MDADTRRKLLIALGVGGIVFLGFALRRTYQLNSIKNRYCLKLERSKTDQSLHVSKKDLIRILNDIKERCNEEIKAITTEYRAKRRKVMESPSEYEDKVRKMYKKIEKCCEKNISEVLRSYKISQSLLEKSIEAHNCLELTSLMNNLTTVESEKLKNPDQVVIEKILASHKKLYNSLLDSTDISCLNGEVLSAMVEDRIFTEYGVELNDVLQYCEKMNEHPHIKNKISELKESVASLQRLNKNAFK